VYPFEEAAALISALLANLENIESSTTFPFSYPAYLCRGILA
jgi:hypothetical protein